MKMLCRVCGGPFNCEPSRVKDGRGIYCSRACQYRVRPIRIHPLDSTLALVDLGKAKSAAKRQARKHAEDFERFEAKLLEAAQ